SPDALDLRAGQHKAQSPVAGLAALQRDERGKAPIARTVPAEQLKMHGDDGGGRRVCRAARFPADRAGSPANACGPTAARRTLAGCACLIGTPGVLPASEPGVGRTPAVQCWLL